MPTIIEETVHIDAAPARVWGVLVDVERWPAWTESVRRLERVGGEPLAVGSQARIWLRGGMGPSRWTVTELTPERSFTWESRPAPGLLTVADHELEPHDGGTRVLLRVTMSGAMSRLWGALLLSVSRRNVAAEAAGLRGASEGSGAGGDVRG